MRAVSGSALSSGVQWWKEEPRSMSLGGAEGVQRRDRHEWSAHTKDVNRNSEECPRTYSGLVLLSGTVVTECVSQQRGLQ